MKKYNSLEMLALAGLCAGASVAAGETIVFNETEFAPGAWNAVDAFWTWNPVGGESGSATTGRFQHGAPPDSFLITQYLVDIPALVSNGIQQPVLFDGWTHDPSSQGAITSIAASVRTFPVAEGMESVAAPFVFLVQDGRYFRTGIGGFATFSFAEPEAYRNVDSLTADLFYEVGPGMDLDIDSHPDFAGGPIQFGFGMLLGSTGLSGEGQTARLVGWDDVSIRMQVVPSPGAAALLATAGLLSVRRRR